MLLESEDNRPVDDDCRRLRQELEDLRTQEAVLLAEIETLREAAKHDEEKEATALARLDKAREEAREAEHALDRAAEAERKAEEAARASKARLAATQVTAHTWRRLPVHCSLKHHITVDELCLGSNESQVCYAGGARSPDRSQSCPGGQALVQRPQARRMFPSRLRPNHVKNSSALFEFK